MHFFTPLGDGCFQFFEHARMGFAEGDFDGGEVVVVAEYFAQFLQAGDTFVGEFWGDVAEDVQLVGQIFGAFAPFVKVFIGGGMAGVLIALAEASGGFFETRAQIGLAKAF